MRFGVFYELQLPRPWNDGDEHRLFNDALAQVELADRLGFDFAWQVEHHFLDEYSHSSAPEDRVVAARLMVLCGTPAKAILRRALADRDDDVREAVEMSLVVLDR